MVFCFYGGTTLYQGKLRKMNKSKLISILFLMSAFCLSLNVNALEFRYWLRSPKALLMGDAFTAVTDDEYTLFYNPAALGGVKDVQIAPLNVTVGITNFLANTDILNDFPSDAVSIANKVMDIPIYTQLSTAPGFKMGPIAVSLIANTSASIALRNATHPVLDIDYRYDKGAIIGYAYSMGSGGKRVKGVIQPGFRLSLGAAVKTVSRQGLQGSFSFFGTDLLNAVNGSSDFTIIRKKLGYSVGSGYGFDAGAEVGMAAGNILVKSGFSILDIADTKFVRSEGFRKIPRQKMAMNWGTSFTQQFLLFDYTLSFDIHPINSTAAFASKLHAGIQVGLPGLKVFAGFNGGYPSYGATIKFWPISITAGIYSIELGSSYRNNEGSRAILYISLFDVDLDIF
jgi:hypothetical protein